MASTKKIPKRGQAGYWEYMKKVGVEAIKESRAGRPKKIESPEKLWEYACEYFQEVDSRPFQREDFIKSGDKGGQKVKLNNIMPYTWAGLETYLMKHKIIQSLEDYRLNYRGAYDEYSGVIARITQTMYDQKFSGATVGAFKENIIARDLRLNDNTDLTVTPVSEIKVSVKRKQ